MDRPDVPIELWGGVECTWNRVGDEYRSQVDETGHADRPGDLQRIADLGIRRVRYPVLWEEVACQLNGGEDWRRVDQRMAQLRRVGLEPIAGLLHHGSGPPTTSLLDSAMPALLASYARRVAERYEWVSAFTPINEPLTTARFAALYGHWYPHQRNDRAFAEALLNQCRAVILAMREIRTVRSDARLVQTEDLGQTHSEAELGYQRDFENVRRWSTFDLLCGRIDRHHAFGDYLQWLGVEEAALDWFQDNPCPPDILGVNYYVTSERYLCRSHYSQGNGRDRYEDVEAVRAARNQLRGPCDLLQQAHERYRLPLAITECHLGCSREEQVRWLYDVWRCAQRARQAGADVRAVTVWSLFGAMDWDSLVTVRRSHYESGAYDIRGRHPRVTAVGKLARVLARGGIPDLPALQVSGWWHGAVATGDSPWQPDTGEANAAPLVITGAGGTLGAALQRICVARRIPAIGLLRADLDIADADAVDATLHRLKPWAVVNAAGFAQVDDAEGDQAKCWRANVLGAETLARACRRHGVRFVAISSDLVFDGNRTTPYLEPHRTNPLGAYGRSKAEAEHRILAAHREALIVRASSFFSPWDTTNFLTGALSKLVQGVTPRVIKDVILSCAYLPEFVHATLDLLTDEERGVWHVANEGPTTCAEVVRVAAHALALEGVAEEVSCEALQLPARRPRYTVLGSRHGRLLSPWPDAVAKYVSEASVPGGPLFPVLATMGPSGT